MRFLNFSIFVLLFWARERARRHVCRDGGSGFRVLIRWLRFHGGGGENLMVLFELFEWGCCFIDVVIAKVPPFEANGAGWKLRCG